MTQAQAEAGAARQEEIPGSNDAGLETDHAPLVAVEHPWIYAT